MKKLLIVFLVGIGILYLLVVFFTSSSYPISEREILTLKVKNEVAQSICDKYRNMRCIGVGGAEQGGKTSMTSLSFVITQPLDKNSARCLLVDCAEEFLKIINENKTLRSYLVHYPFTVKNIELCIFIHTSEDQRVFYPLIHAACLENGDINYFTKSPESEFGYKTEEDEAYEEALRIVQEKGNCVEQPPASVEQTLAGHDHLYYDSEHKFDALTRCIGVRPGLKRMTDFRRKSAWFYPP